MILLDILEIVIQRRLGNFRPFRHLLNGGILIPLGAEQLARSLQNPLAALDFVQFPSALLFHHSDTFRPFPPQKAEVILESAAVLYRNRRFFLLYRKLYHLTTVAAKELQEISVRDLCENYTNFERKFPNRNG